MVTGWKAISQYTGFSSGTIKKLHRRDDFPLLWIANRPVIHEKSVDTWLDEKGKKTKNKK